MEPAKKPVKVEKGTLLIVIVIIAVISYLVMEITKPASVAEEESPSVVETEEQEIVTNMQEVAEEMEQAPVSDKPKPVREEITYEDFNGRFEQDTDETQYPNGKFQLKDGSVVTADYLFYSENDVFDYAMAIFHEGVLADIQIETTLSESELSEALGISFDAENVRVEPYRFGYKITFDKSFSDTNVDIYPNEWD